MLVYVSHPTQRTLSGKETRWLLKTKATLTGVIL